MILRLQQGLLDEGIRASLSQLCRWFEVPRRTVYYQPTKAAPKVDQTSGTISPMPLNMRYLAFIGSRSRCALWARGTLDIFYAY